MDPGVHSPMLGVQLPSDIRLLQWMSASCISVSNVLGIHRTLWIELQNSVLFLTLLKHPPDSFNLFDYVCFNNNSARSFSTNKLVPTSSCIPQLNLTRHYYFYQIVRVWKPLRLTYTSPLKYLSVYFHYWVGAILSTIYNAASCSMFVV